LKRVARYLSLHALGCLPKPAFAALCRSLFASGGAATRRILAGQVAEQLLVEFDAPDAGSAAAWLRERRLTPLWVMRVDYESSDGALVEL
jgi:hypothetical protein